MSITVKKLIDELLKIENDYLEVECCVTENRSITHEIECVRKVKTKVLIFTKESND